MTYDELMPVVPFRIEKEYKAALRDLAKENGHTTNTFIRKIVKDYFNKHGIVINHPQFDIKKVPV